MNITLYIQIKMGSTRYIMKSQILKKECTVLNVSWAKKKWKSLLPQITTTICNNDLRRKLKWNLNAKSIRNWIGSNPTDFLSSTVHWFQMKYISSDTTSCWLLSPLHIFPILTFQLYSSGECNKSVNLFVFGNLWQRYYPYVFIQLVMYWCTSWPYYPSHSILLPGFSPFIFSCFVAMSFQSWRGVKE